MGERIEVELFSSKNRLFWEMCPPSSHVTSLTTRPLRVQPSLQRMRTSLSAHRSIHLISEKVLANDTALVFADCNFTLNYSPTPGLNGVIELISFSTSFPGTLVAVLDNNSTEALLCFNSSLCSMCGSVADCSDCFPAGCATSNMSITNQSAGNATTEVTISCIDGSGHLPPPCVVLPPPRSP